MPTTITTFYFDCDCGALGTVKVIQRYNDRSRLTKTESKKCTSCKKLHGLKQVMDLKERPDLKQTVTL